jgi:hypothetical protein
MAVGFDAASESHAGTTGNTSSASFTWNHVPAGTPRGALVFVFSIGALTDTSVTYGGTTMLAVPYTAADTDTELGAVRAYYLDNCGTGTKAVVVNRTNNAVQMYAVAYTVTASTPTEVYQAGVKTKAASTAIATAASSTGTGTGTLAEDTVTDGSPGTNSLRFMGRYQGTSNVTAAGPNSTAPASAAASIDFGLFVIDTFYETTAGQGARNVGGATITDDVAAILLAVREIPLAGVGSATGTSQQPLAHVATMGGVASATGTAYNATAQALTATSAPAEVASATGTSRAPTASVGAVAGVGSATGTALQPTVRGEALAPTGLASATGTAQAPKASVGAAPAAASATGTAQAAKGSVGATAPSASATGTARAPTVGVSSKPGVAAALAAAYDPTGSVGVIAGLASAVGTAWNPTIQIVGGGPLVSVDAGNASAVGTAHDPTVVTVEAAIIPPLGGHHLLPTEPLPRLIPRTLAFAATASARGVAHNPTVRVDWLTDEYLLGLTDAQLSGD